MTWQRHIVLAEAAAENVIRYGRRTGVVILCLVAFLAPLATAIAVSDGVKAQAAISVEKGPDIVVSMDFGGRSAPVPLEYVDEIKKIDEVKKVIPRIVGRIYLGKKLLIIVGIPPEEISMYVSDIAEGRAIRPDDERAIMVGPGLVQFVKEEFEMVLKPDSTVLLWDVAGDEWYFMVVGIFSASDITIWNYDMVLMAFEDAQKFWGFNGTASDLLVYVTPGYEAPIYEKINRVNPYFRIQDRSLIKMYYNAGFTQRQGTFTMIYLIVLVLAIPLMSMLATYGLTERKREVGILKASGWQTIDIIELVVIEMLILSTFGAISAVIFSVIWIKVFNGFLIAQLFISQLDVYPAFLVPALFSPYLIALCLFLSMIITMVGTISSTWVTAITPPAEAMR